MGSEISSCPLYGGVYRSPSMACFRSQFETLRLKEGEVGSLFKIFNKVGLAANVFHISEIALCAHIDICSSVLLRKLMGIDDSSHPIVAFENFVKGLWKICTVIQIYELAKCIFELYDSRRGSGLLDENQLIVLFEDLHLRPVNNGKGRRASLGRTMIVSPEANLLTQEGEKKIDCKTFCEFINARQGLLIPLQQLQVALTNRICGKRFWARIAERRVYFEALLDTELDDLIEKDRAKLDIEDTAIDPYKLKKSVNKVAGFKQSQTVKIAPDNINYDTPNHLQGAAAIRGLEDGNENDNDMNVWSKEGTDEVALSNSWSTGRRGSFVLSVPVDEQAQAARRLRALRTSVAAGRYQDCANVEDDGGSHEAASITPPSTSTPTASQHHHQHHQQQHSSKKTTVGGAGGGRRYSFASSVTPYQDAPTQQSANHRQRRRSSTTRASFAEGDSTSASTSTSSRNRSGTRASFAVESVESRKRRESISRKSGVGGESGGGGNQPQGGGGKASFHDISDADIAIAMSRVKWHQ